MKQLKKDLKEVSKTLLQLTRKTEQMAKSLESLDKAAPKAKTAKGVVAKKRAVSRAKEPTAIGRVLDIIKASKKGVDTAKLKEKTGFDDKKVYNCIFILKRKGLVKSAQKGIYVTA